MANVADMTNLGCPSGYIHFLIIDYVGYVVDEVFMVGIQFTAIQILRGIWVVIWCLSWISLLTIWLM